TTSREPPSPPPPMPLTTRHPPPLLPPLLLRTPLPVWAGRRHPGLAFPPGLRLGRNSDEPPPSITPHRGRCRRFPDTGLADARRRAGGGHPRRTARAAPG